VVPITLVLPLSPPLLLPAEPASLLVLPGVVPPSVALAPVPVGVSGPVSLAEVTLLTLPLADRLSPFAPESPQARSNGERTRSHFERARIMRGSPGAKLTCMMRAHASLSKLKSG
jgi:hypothetical protein